EVGATTKLQYTLAWSGSVQPANTTPVFMYRPSGSTYAWLAPAVTVSGGNDQVLIDWAAPGAYDYDVQYRDASGKTLQEATGTFSVAASGASSSTAAFQHRETMITWSKSTQPPDTTPVFSYAPAGSQAFITAPIVELNGNLQVTLVNVPDGQYDYYVRYYSDGDLIREASNRFTSSASSFVAETLSFATGSISAPRPEINTFTYDAAGRRVSSTDAEGYSERYAYDALGNKISFTNKNGATWTYVYDADRRMTSELSPQVQVTSVDPVTLVATSASASIETRTEYDALGNAVARTEAYGRPEARRTQYQYDALGRQVSTIFPAVSVYDAAHEDLSTNGINGTVAAVQTTVTPQTHVSFDALGNATVNRDVAGNYSYKVYDALGRVSHEIDAEHYVTAYAYDRFGNKLTTTRYATALDFAAITGHAAHADGVAFSLAEVAARIAPSAGDRTVTTQYDILNRAVLVTQPAAFSYDATAPAGAPQYFTVGATTRYTYDTFGEAIRQSQLKNPGTDLAVGTADDTWTDTYTYYNRRGYKKAQVDALGYITTWEYDASGDVVRQVDYARALSQGTWNLSGYA